MKKVILVESDPNHIEAYRHIFQKGDFDVELARTKEEMLEELREIRNGDSAQPDLVVLDLMLADGHSMEILRAIKKSHFTKHIPVFAVTNYQSRDFEREVDQSGIAPEKYLIKAHFTPNDLLDTIERRLGQKPPRPNRTQLS